MLRLGEFIFETFCQVQNTHKSPIIVIMVLFLLPFYHLLLFNINLLSLVVVLTTFVDKTLLYLMIWSEYTGKGVSCKWKLLTWTVHSIIEEITIVILKINKHFFLFLSLHHVANYCSFLNLIVVNISFFFVILSSTSLFVTMSTQLIPKILLYDHILNALQYSVS